MHSSANKGRVLRNRTALPAPAETRGFFFDFLFFVFGVLMLERRLQLDPRFPERRMSCLQAAYERL
jgi:hypothetical protein